MIAVKINDVDINFKIIPIYLYSLYLCQGKLLIIHFINTYVFDFLKSISKYIKVTIPREKYNIVNTTSSDRNTII